MLRKLLGVFVLTVLLLTACSTASQKDVNKMEPSELVQTFYESGARKDYNTAKACLDNEYATSTDGFKRYFKNVKKRRNIQVSEFSNIPLYGENFLEGQVVVEYDATYKAIITQEDGNQIRFVYVAKVKEDSPWKIISIGTGP